MKDWLASAAFPLPSTSSVTVVPRDTDTTLSSSCSGTASGVAAGMADGGVPAPVRVTWPDPASLTLTLTRMPAPVVSCRKAVVPPGGGV